MNNNWIKINRLRVGLSQDELAAQLQISGFDTARATVSHWEQGLYLPPLEKPEFCKALAGIFRMSVKSLLSEAGYEIDQRSPSKNAEQAAYIVDHLPEDKQELALRLLEQLAKT